MTQPASKRLLTEANANATYAPASFAADSVGHDVVAILGQSNARGDGEGIDLTYLDFTSTRVLQFVGSASNPLYRQAVLAVDPLLHHTPATDSSHGVGAGVVFGREYSKTLHPNRTVLLVPSARGQTGFTSTDYCWDYTATPSIENLAVSAKAQIHAALALPGNNRLVGIIWLQGENDVALTESQYAAKLDALIDWLRVDFANVPFLIGSMNPDKVAEGNAGYIAVNAAHIDTPRRKALSWFVKGPLGCSNSATNGGTIHYNGKGQRALGVGYARRLSYALANVVGSPPVPPESVAVAQVGTTLNVTWETGKGRSTDFAVSYKVGAGAWTPLTRAQSIEPVAAVTGLTLGSTVTVRVASVNEQGTSAPTEAAAFVLDTLPGQVTGLAAGTPTANRVDLSWSALAGARTYKVEYKRNVDSTWITATTTAATSASVSGLNTSTAYNFRVTAVNWAGASTTPSSTVNATTASIAFLAATVGSDPLNAYALRKIRSAYSGSAIRVRRSSDNTEADIGFTGAGVVDEAALLSHVGAGDGYITKWYDQGTGAVDFAQTTTGLQPQIAASGVVHKVNGLPAVKFSGAQYLSHSTPALFAASAVTTLLVHTAPATAASQAVFGEDNNGTSGYYFPAYYNSAGQPTYYDGSTARVGSGLVIDGALMQQTSRDTGSALTIHINGVQKLNYTPYTPPGSTVVRGRMGAYIPGAASAFFTGYVSEAVAWTSSLGTTPTDDGQANQKSYYSTP